MNVINAHDGSYASNTYIIEKNNEVIIIDASTKLEHIKSIIKDKKVVAIILTHGHYDHFIHLNSYLQYFKCKFILNKNCIEKIQDPNKSYARAFGSREIIDLTNVDVHKCVDNEEVILGDNFKVKFINTPGHTNCSITCIIDNAIFTGDTLFADSAGVGRTDLYSSSEMDLKQSLKRLAKLNGNYELYPGHSYGYNDINDKHLLKNAIVNHIL